MLGFIKSRKKFLPSAPKYMQQKNKLSFNRNYTPKVCYNLWINEAAENLSKTPKATKN